VAASGVDAGSDGESLEADLEKQLFGDESTPVPPQAIAGSTPAPPKVAAPVPAQVPAAASVEASAPATLPAKAKSSGRARPLARGARPAAAAGGASSSASAEASGPAPAPASELAPAAVAPSTGDAPAPKRKSRMEKGPEVAATAKKPKLNPAEGPEESKPAAPHQGAEEATATTTAPPTAEPQHGQQLPGPPPTSPAPKDTVEENFWTTSLRNLNQGTMSDSDDDDAELRDRGKAPKTTEAADARGRSERLSGRQEMPPPTQPPAKKMAPQRDEKKGEKEVQWTYGFDRHARKAFRLKQGPGRCPPDWADSVQLPENAGPTDSPVARWSDGCSWAVPTLTRDAYTAMLAGKPAPRCPPPQKQGRAGKGDLFEGVHCKTGARVRVLHLKCDNIISLKMKEVRKESVRKAPAERQICQCSFGTVKNNKSVATDIVTQVAKRFVNNELQLEELYDERDKLVVQFLDACEAGHGQGGHGGKAGGGAAGSSSRGLEEEAVEEDEEESSAAEEQPSEAEESASESVSEEKGARG